jgi:hypothetical protein
MPGVGVEVSLMADRLTRTGHERSLSRRGRLVVSGIVGLVACLGAPAYAAQTLAAAAPAGSPPTRLTVDYAAHPLAIESAPYFGGDSQLARQRAYQIKVRTSRSSTSAL